MLLAKDAYQLADSVGLLSTAFNPKPLFLFTAKLLRPWDVSFLLKLNDKIAFTPYFSCA